MRAPHNPHTGTGEGAPCAFRGASVAETLPPAGGTPSRRAGLTFFTPHGGPRRHRQAARVRCHGSSCLKRCKASFRRPHRPGLGTSHRRRHRGHLSAAWLPRPASVAALAWLESARAAVCRVLAEPSSTHCQRQRCGGRHHRHRPVCCFPHLIDGTQHPAQRRTPRWLHTPHQHCHKQETWVLSFAPFFRGLTRPASLCSCHTRSLRPGASGSRG